MATMGLGLTASTHRTLFRKVVEVLKYDPTLRRVITTWVTWDGSPVDRTPDTDFSDAQCPVCTLAPARGPDAWYGPDSYVGPLIIRIGLMVAGTDIDDLLDLYQAVVDATWPDDATKRETVNLAFLSAGAQAYALQQFTQPSFTVTGTPDSPLLVATGQLQFPVSTGINP